MTTMDGTLERVRTEARALDPGKVALTLVAVPLFALGFVAAKVVGVAWTVIAWSWTAAVVGWRAARDG